jgi:GNAT superfamily N-acetyltransferase
LNFRAEFREANLSDHAKITEFQLAMALETEGMRLDGAACSEGVLAILRNPHLGSYYVAEVDKVDATAPREVVACLLIIREWSDWRNGCVWWIHSVYVIPSIRKNGVFKDFFKFIQRQGEITENIRGLRLYVDKRNQAAQNVYKKLGMDSQHYDLYEWMRHEPERNG